MTPAYDPVVTAREQFLRDTCDHQLTVLHDDGLYRHLRFQSPGRSFYYYDLVTWPGHLVICGDAGDFHFSRISDMFDFFNSDSDRINPGYWAEKLQVPGGGTRHARTFSNEKFRSVLAGWAREACEDWGPHGELDEDDGHGAIYPTLLAGAIDRELTSSHVHDEHEARETLERIQQDDRGQDIGLHMHDTWEWDFTDFDSRYLWCCWAIVHGIRSYRTTVIDVAS